MIAYVISSPFQLYNCLQLQITENTNRKADIYIVEQFTQCREMAYRLEKTKLFNKVILVKNFAKKQRGFCAFIMRNFLYRLFGKKYIKSKYNEAIFCAVDTTVFALLKYMKQNNRSITLIKNEEGIGDYSRSVFWTASQKDYYISKACNNVPLFEEKEVCHIMQNMYLHCPEARVDYPRFRARTIKKAPDKEFSILINQVFNVDEIESISEKIILFDIAAIGKRNYLRDQSLLDIYSNIKNVVGDNDIMIKLHPRRRENIYNAPVKYQGIPMEALYFNMKEQINNKILLGISTAMFAPKLLFDYEPVLIFLHKMLDGLSSDMKEKMDLLIKSISKMYHEKNRILQPQTIDELVLCLERLTKNEKTE